MRGTNPRGLGRAGFSPIQKSEINMSTRRKSDTNGICLDCPSRVEGRRLRCDDCRRAMSRLASKNWKARNRAKQNGYNLAYQKRTAVRARLACHRSYRKRRELQGLKPGQWKIDATPNRTCADCDNLAAPRKLRCDPCRIERTKRLARIAHERYRKRRPDLVRARNARYRAKHHKAAPRLPVVAWQMGSSAALAAINAVVPRSIAGRDDVCQSLALALLEGRISTDDLAHRAREFVRSFQRENFEGRGFAVSLSQPRHDGRSWDDLLPDNSERLWEART